MPAGVQLRVLATPQGGGTTRGLPGTGTASISGTTVTVTLTSAVVNGETLKLYYWEPTANPLQDASGNKVANISDQSITNETPPPGSVLLVDAMDGCAEAACPDAPTGHAAPGPGHGEITVTWTLAATGGAPVKWQVKQTPDGGSAVSEILTDASTRSHTFTGLDPAKDHDVVVQGIGSDGANDKFGDAAVARDVRPKDTNQPTVSSAEVDGTELTITFNENLDTGSVPAPGDFNVTVGGARRNVASGGVAINGATVTLTLASAVTSTDTVTLAYTQPSANPLQDPAGNAVADFTGRTVTNNTLPPGWVRLVDIGGGCAQATCPDAPTGHARPGGASRRDRGGMDGGHHRRNR